MMRLTALAAGLAFAAAVAAQVAVTDFLGSGNPAGFERADVPRSLVFPADHAAHPRFRTEWWYFTGNLADEDGRHFGFQLTFFRFALAPEAQPRASAWATNQAWMAHLTVTDSAGHRFHAAERLARGALGLAGAETAPFRVWLGDWQAASAGVGRFFPLRLTAQDREIGIELELAATKPVVLQGEDGLDRKGPEPGNASYYYSYTRLASSGQLRVAGTEHAVTGSAWMDREWSSNALAPDLAGWDWFALQFDDGRELMLYRLRRRDGSASPFSRAVLVQPDGRKLRFGADQFTAEPLRWWTSPKTGRRYPVAWQLRLPAQQFALEVRPRVDDQELDLSVRYWEGAVTAAGRNGNRELRAQGHLELAGY